MKKNVALILLALLVVWLSASLVRVENQRYAQVIGMCRDGATGLSDLPCLAEVETRTSWFWHLAYGLGIVR